MRMFCRYCWIFVTPKLCISTKHEHIEANCPICNNWIKHLNKKEVIAYVKKQLEEPRLRILGQKISGDLQKRQINRSKKAGLSSYQPGNRRIVPKTSKSANRRRNSKYD